jgi:hypothetical protein
VTDDLVDDFYRRLNQPLGNLVILSALAEAALLDLTAALKGVDERQAQGVLNAKDAKRKVLELVRSSRLKDLQLAQLLDGLDRFWWDKASCNRFIHDEWFPLLDGRGKPSTRGLPKDSDIVWSAPAAEDIWALAKSFRDHEHLFSRTAHIIRRARAEPAGAKVVFGGPA